MGLPQQQTETKTEHPGNQFKPQQSVSKLMKDVLGQSSLLQGVAQVCILD